MKDMFSFQQLEYHELPDVQNYMSEDIKSRSELLQNSRIQQEEHVEPFLPYVRSDDLSPLSFQLDQEECARLRNIHHEISELASLEEKKPSASGLSTFEILNFTTKFWQHNPVKPNNAPSSDTVSPEEDDRSVNKIIRLAGEKFMLSNSPPVDDLLEHSDPPSITSFLHQDDEEARDVEAIKNLLASADKVGEQQFDNTRKLLSQCNEYSSDKGSAVQRLVYYFSAALQERIDREMGIKTSHVNNSPVLQEPVINCNTLCLALFQQLPFCRVMQFTAMQAIIENVAEAKKIHIIDLEIKNGTHFPIVIQALAIRYARPVEHLKITAVGTKSRRQIEDTGKRLINFAKSMNLSLDFNVVMVADMLDINESLFDLDPDEVVAVYLPFVLSTMIAQPDRLECLMRVIRNMNPCVMVVGETEANHNSAVFVKRFVEALFFFGAFFDCLVDCMDPDDPNRFILESVVFGQGIRNIVASDGKDRTVRQVKNNVWKAFFLQFDMVQKELSMSSLFQAILVAKNFGFEKSCSLNMDGKSMILGWKGTSVISLSVWKSL